MHTVGLWRYILAATALHLVTHLQPKSTTTNRGVGFVKSEMSDTHLYCSGNFSDMLIFDAEGALQARHSAGTREPLEGPLLKQMVAKL